MILNVFQGKCGSKAGGMEGKNGGGRLVMVMPDLIQAPTLMSPGACSAHGTIVDLHTMRSHFK